MQIFLLVELDDMAFLTIDTSPQDITLSHDFVHGWRLICMAGVELGEVLERNHCKVVSIFIFYHLMLKFNRENGGYTDLDSQLKFGVVVMNSYKLHKVKLKKVK